MRNGVGGVAKGGEREDEGGHDVHQRIQLQSRADKYNHLSSLRIWLMYATVPEHVYPIDTKETYSN